MRDTGIIQSYFPRQHKDFTSGMHKIQIWLNLLDYIHVSMGHGESLGIVQGSLAVLFRRVDFVM